MRSLRIALDPKRSAASFMKGLQSRRVSHEVMSPSCFESCEFRANFHVNPSCKQDENLALACSDTNADEVEKLLCQPRIPDSKGSGGITSSSFKSFCASREILTLKGQMAGQPSTVQQKTAT